MREIQKVERIKSYSISSSNLHLKSIKFTEKPGGEPIPKQTDNFKRLAQLALREEKLSDIGLSGDDDFERLFFRNCAHSFDMEGGIEHLELEKLEIKPGCLRFGFECESGEEELVWVDISLRDSNGEAVIENRISGGENCTIVWENGLIISITEIIRQDCSDRRLERKYERIGGKTHTSPDGLVDYLVTESVESY